MQYRRLGRTNLEVSCLCLGGIGMISPEKNLEYFRNIVMTALDEGFNIIDTARTYYRSEDILGEILTPALRKKCYITTKSFIRTKKGILREIDRSLESLRTDYIDIYQCHHVQYEYELERIMSPGGAMEGLRQARETGKINYIGVSSHRPDVMIKCIETGEFDVIEVPLNPIEKEHFQSILDKAREFDLGIIIMKSLAGGQIKHVAEALKFVLSHDISTVAVGCTSAEQVRFDAKVAREFKSLTQEEKKLLIEEINNLDEQFCRRCRYCETQCPQKIPISEVFRCESYLILNATYARDEYRKIKDKVKKCENCGNCEKICPYQLPVRKMMLKARKRLEKGRLEDFAVNFLRKIRLYDLVRTIYFKLGGRVPKR